MAEENIIKVFEYALNQEKTGMLFFENALKVMGMGEAITAFEMLIEEERKHIMFIENILIDLREKGEISVLEEITIPRREFFDTRSKETFLKQSIESSMVPDITVFNTAWLIEKDLSEFYGRMADKATGKSKDAFEMLSFWEKGHEAFFRECRDHFSKIYANMPWGG